MSVASPDIRKRDMWQLSLTGKLDPDLPLELDVLEQELRDNFFHLRLLPKFVPDYDLDPLLDPSNKAWRPGLFEPLRNLRDKLLKMGMIGQLRWRISPCTTDWMPYVKVRSLRGGE